MSYYVYIIESETRDGSFGLPVKIGITGNPDARLANLRTANPYRICYGVLLDAGDKETALRIEGAMHSRFSFAALEGEWFAVDPNIAATTMAKCFEYALIASANEFGWSFDELTARMAASGVNGLRDAMAAGRYENAWLQEAA